MSPEITVIGNWAKVEVLGSGGFGNVTLWKNKLNDDMIALKTSHLAMKSQCKDRWSREVEIMLKLSHLNIVKAIPTPKELMYLSPGSPILTMEYCEKGDLRKVLLLPENCSGLPEPFVRKALKNVKQAIEYLHKENIIHRDLKPENIVLKETNNEITFKLVDLGFAKELNQNSLRSTFVGTLQYVAPEVFTRVYTKSVDYWSFGLVCHELITGFRPFLPNMTPYTWIPLVKKKSFDDICIYQNEDDTIIYSKEISTECYISQNLRCELESWLRLALAWDGSNRGRNRNGGLVIFSLLESILEKKIITVFSCVAMDLLSYEVDGSTAIRTLKDWIERDTKTPVDDQVLLLPTGVRVPEDGLAVQYWDYSVEVSMVYVFDKNGLKLNFVQLKIPYQVNKMLEKPRIPRKYYFLRRIWTSSIYFLKNEIFRCQTFMEAYAVKLLSIMIENQKVKSLDAVVNNEIQQVFGYHKLLEDSFDYDMKCWQCLRVCDGSVSGLDELLKRRDLHNTEIKQLGQVGEKLGHKISLTTKQLSNIQAYLDTNINPSEQFKKILEMAYAVYDTLHKRPKEVRGTQEETVDLSMVKIINNFLNTREKFFNDQYFHKHLREVIKCENDVLSIVDPLTALRQHVSRVKRSLRKSQLQRQKSVWQLYVNVKQPITPTSPESDPQAKQILEKVQGKDENKLQILLHSAISKRQSFNEDLTVSRNMIKRRNFNNGLESFNNFM